MGRSCRHDGKGRSDFNISTGNPTGERPLGRPRRR